MAQILASGKKIDFVKNVTEETLKLQRILQEGILDVKKTANEINQSTFVKTYNALVDGINAFNEVTNEISTLLVNSADNWSSVPGIAQVAKVGFEEASAEAKKIKSNIIEAKIMELPDDLHENVTDDLTRKFTDVLNDVMVQPREYIKRVAEVINDTSTDDTRNLYVSIGAGIERVTNAFVRAYNENKAELQKWNIALENIQSDTQTKANTRISSVDNTTSVLEKKVKADIL